MNQENELLAVVTVADDKKVVCLHDNCMRPISKAVHIVRIDGKITVVGSTCYKKSVVHLISQKNQEAKYLGAAGTMLSENDRELLLNNTESLIEQYETHAIKKLEEDQIWRDELKAKREKEERE